MNKYLILWLYNAIVQISYANILGLNENNIECPAKKSFNYLNNTVKPENLYIGEPHTVSLDKGIQKRFIFVINVTSPLFVTFSTHSQEISRKLYFNQTVNLTKHIKSEAREIFFSCALNGQYDLIVSSKRKISMRILIIDKHRFANWTYLNHNIPIEIRTKNRMQKKQMIIKWNKSQLDIHAIHYCLVINTKSSYKNFCQAVQDYFGLLRKENCSTNLFYNSDFLLKQRDRIGSFDSQMTNIVCTGSKNRQIFKGLIPNTKYFIDIFGVHTKLRNLTFILKSTTAFFNRTQPNRLTDDTMTMEKISIMTSVSIFSYKIPSGTSEIGNNLNILILPCYGGQVDVKILKQRKKVHLVEDIYRPTYIQQSNVQPNDRYIIRITSSTEDEIFKASKIGIAVTNKEEFKSFPRLPVNTTIFEIRSIQNCKSTTITWYSTPETREFRYCVIVFHLANANRSSLDQTNYCMDFGKKVTSHPQFYRIRCFKPIKRQKFEHFPLLNLFPGETYLIYVTVNLIKGKTLPYESLKINVNKNCHIDVEEFQWKNSSFEEY